MHIIAQKSAFGKGKRGGFREKTNFVDLHSLPEAVVCKLTRKQGKMLQNSPFILHRNLLYYNG